MNKTWYQIIDLLKRIIKNIVNIKNIIKKK